MSTNGAVNVEYGVERVRRLDRLAAKQGMKRNDLLRRMADEAFLADDEGRPMFAQPVEEPSTADVRHLIEENKNLNSELERSRKQQDKREKGQVERDAAFARRLSALEEERAAAVEAAVYRTEAHLIIAVQRAMAPSLDRVGADLKEVKARGVAIERWAKEPRKAFGLILGDGRFWSTVFVVKYSLLIFGSGMLLMGVLGLLFTDLGVWLSHKMMAGDAEFCRLVDYRFGEFNCQVPREHRFGAAKPGEAQ